MRLFRRGPRVRDDYRRYDMNRMKSWGHNAFWWPSQHVGERACIFGPRPHEGDVLTCDEDAYVIVSVSTPSDPGDQHFVEVKRWGVVADLPETKRVSTWVDGLV